MHFCNTTLNTYLGYYRYGQSKIVTFLINQEGVNVIAKDRNKLTPLALAKRYVYEENDICV